MNVKIVALAGAGLIGVYLLLRKSPASQVQSGQRNAGIGGAATKTGGVSAYPIGNLVTSVAQLGAQLFPRGSGTHAPVDQTIKSPGTLGGIVTSYDQLEPKSTVPAPSEIVTQLDDYNPNVYFSDQQADVSPSDYIITGEDYWSD